MSAEEELKPCPFCGCENIRSEQKGPTGWVIKCANCLIGYQQKTIRFSLDWLKQEMIKSWNMSSPGDIIEWCFEELTKENKILNLGFKIVVSKNVPEGEIHINEGDDLVAKIVNISTR